MEDTLAAEDFPVAFDVDPSWLFESEHFHTQSFPTLSSILESRSQGHGSSLPDEDISFPHSSNDPDAGPAIDHPSASQLSHQIPNTSEQFTDYLDISLESNDPLSSTYDYRSVDQRHDDDGIWIHTNLDSMQRWTCKLPECANKRPYKRHADLMHHIAKVHHMDCKIDCPRRLCLHKGDNGFRCKDDLKEHLLSYHGVGIAWCRGKKSRTISEPKRHQMSAEQKEILQQKFSLNPYPGAREVAVLSRITGLDSKKIKTWFNNQRSRRLPTEPTNPDSQGPASASQEVQMSLTESNLSSMQQGTRRDSTRSPFSIFLDSPLEEDPALLRAISVLSADPFYTGSGTDPEGESTGFSQFTTPPSAHSSAGSASSASSFCSQSSRGYRRGRKRYAQPVIRSLEIPSFSPLPSPPPRDIRDNHSNYTPSLAGAILSPYPQEPRGGFRCTFCGKALVTLYQWKRHEESVHAPRSFWTCDLPCCEGSKNAAERTYMRKDQFVQHLRSVHELEDVVEIVKRAHTKASPIHADHSSLLCGFCGVRLEDWDSRVQHIGDHFHQGADFSEWWLKRLGHDSFHCPSKCFVAFPVPEGIEGQFGYSGNTCLCTYCHRRFPDLQTAAKQHPYCEIWSCRFLRGHRACFDYGPGCLRCSYCLRQFGDSMNFPEQIQHLHREHKYRSCSQGKYTSRKEFEGHLRSAHRTKSSLFLDFDMTSEPYSAKLVPQFTLIVGAYHGNESATKICGHNVSTVVPWQELMPVHTDPQAEETSARTPSYGVDSAFTSLTRDLGPDLDYNTPFVFSDTT